MQAPETAAREAVISVAVALLCKWREAAPRVHCITNAVAQNFTANALLAAGGVPSMTLDPEEIGAFVARANALLVNLGTFDAERRKAADIAVKTASERQVPWVLDPVFVERSGLRAKLARELIERGPNVVRLNQVEFAALAGREPARANVVDYARTRGLVVALSGETDLVTDGTRVCAIGNGHPLMAKVTAMGCAGSALVAAALAVQTDVFRATAAAMLVVGVAGELAAAKAEGPGSFAAAFLDALYTIDAPDVSARAKVK